MAKSNQAVFIAANVLVEIIDQRRQMDIAVDVLENYKGHLYISTLTGSFAMYFGLKKWPLSHLQNLLGDFKLLALEKDDFDWAFNNIRNNDFEDALQLAVAIRNGCNTFVTLDKQQEKKNKNLPQLQIKLLT